MAVRLEVPRELGCGKPFSMLQLGESEEAEAGGGVRVACSSPKLSASAAAVEHATSLEAGDVADVEVCLRDLPADLLAEPALLKAKARHDPRSRAQPAEHERRHAHGPSSSQPKPSSQPTAAANDDAFNAVRTAMQLQKIREHASKMQLKSAAVRASATEQARLPAGRGERSSSLNLFHAAALSNAAHPPQLRARAYSYPSASRTHSQQLGGTGSIASPYHEHAAPSFDLHADTRYWTQPLQPQHHHFSGRFAPAAGELPQFSLRSITQESMLGSPTVDLSLFKREQLRSRGDVMSEQATSPRQRHLADWPGLPRLEAQRSFPLSSVSLPLESELRLHETKRSRIVELAHQLVAKSTASQDVDRQSALNDLIHTLRSVPSPHVQQRLSHGLLSPATAPVSADSPVSCQAEPVPDHLLQAWLQAAQTVEQPKNQHGWPAALQHTTSRTLADFATASNSHKEVAPQPPPQKTRKRRSSMEVRKPSGPKSAAVRCQSKTERKEAAAAALASATAIDVASFMIQHSELEVLDTLKDIGVGIGGGAASAAGVPNDMQSVEWNDSESVLLFNGLLGDAYAALQSDSLDDLIGSMGSLH